MCIRISINLLTTMLWKALLFIGLVVQTVLLNDIALGSDFKPCVPKRFNQVSFVCVCNETYCDEITTSSKTVDALHYSSYVSSLYGERFSYTEGSFASTPNISDFAEIGNITYQEVIGFGGAFTDAATINIKSLSEGAQQNLINSYFAASGIGYTVGRIPMASCDYSKRVYSYDDHENDTDLNYFSLVDEDLHYKIPVIKAANEVSKTPIKLFGSPWSSPDWMKTNHNMSGKGSIKGQPGEIIYKAWAKYFVKFVQEYEKNGLQIWGLTAQNEPSDGFIADFPFQCLGFSPELQRDFIAKDLGPALKQAGLERVKLMILDDQRVFLPYWAEKVLYDQSAAQYVSGIAVHWYMDFIVPPEALDRTYEQFGQNFFMLNTEACEGDLLNKNRSVLLGSWYRAERYLQDIMQDLRHKVSGWVDWNIALDMSGGPNWRNGANDSPIIINAARNEFYKQPMFYAMGHFSKFVVPGSKMVHIHNKPKDIDMIAFLRPDNSVVSVLGNYDYSEKFFTLYDSNTGYLNGKILPKSFITLTWKRH